MALETFQRGYFTSVFCSSGQGFGATVVTTATRNFGFRASVLTIGTTLATKRLKATLAITHAFPNAYYGLQEADRATITLPNHDQELNFMLNEDPSGSAIRVRRYDEANGEVIDLFQGIISRPAIGDEVELECESMDLNVFDIELPRNRVLTSGQTPPPGFSSLDITQNFPSATDQNVPINIVFGSVPYVPLAYVFADRINNQYDYLVCEDVADVEEVFYLNSNSIWTPKFSVSDKPQAASSTTITISALDSQGAAANPSDVVSNFYTGMYIAITKGTGRGQERKITSYDPLTKIVTIATAWTTLPTINSTYVIREYSILPGTVYYGRTAIRFLFPQEVDGDLRPLAARVSRYRPIKKNRALFTNQFDRDDIWVESLGFFNSTALVRTTGLTDPLGGKTAVSIKSVAPSADDVLVQSLSNPFLTGEPITFSVWLRADTAIPTGAQLYVIGLGTLPVNITTSWQQFSITGANAAISLLEFGFYLPQGTIQIWAAQLERGSTPTWYEEVRDVGQSAAFTVPDAVADILGNPLYGLNQTLDQESIAAANDLLGPLQLKCQGSLPDLSGAGGAAKDILDEILQIRSIRLVKNGSAWSLIPEQSSLPISVLGTYETPEANIIAMDSRKRISLSDKVSTLRVDYGQTYKSTALEAIYPFHLEYPINVSTVSGTTVGFGQPRDLSLRFFRDHNTAARGLQFIGNSIKQAETTWDITVGQIGRSLLPGDVITVNAPRRQTENLLKWSENLSNAVWTNDVAPTAKAAVDPELRSYSATLLQASSNASQAVALSNLGNRKAIFSVWLKSNTALSSATNFPITLEISSTVGGSSNTSVQVGPQWKKFTFERSLPNTASGSVTVKITTGASRYVYAWGAQLCLDYARSYVRTTDVTAPAETTWKVVGFTSNDFAQHVITLIPYDATKLFAYTAPDIPVDLSDVGTGDLRFQPPPPATGLSVPPDPPTPTAAAGVDISSDGVVDSWAEIQFVTPSTNCIEVRVQRRKVELTPGGSELETYWEDAASVKVTEFGLGAPARVKVRGFTPGLRYEIRCAAINVNGYTNFTQATAQFTARGDTTAPNAPVAIKTTLGTGRSIQIDVDVVTRPLTPNSPQTPLPLDFRAVNLYRVEQATATPVPAFTAATWIDRSAKQQFHDNNVQYGKWYFYWATVEDYTGNVSSTVGPTPATQMNKIDGSIEIGSINASVITTGTLTVDGTGSSGADAIKIIESPGSELSFYNTSNNRVAYINVVTAGSSTSVIFGTDYSIGGARTLYFNVWDNIILQSTNIKINGNLCIGSYSVGTVATPANSTAQIPVFDVNGNPLGRLMVYP